MVIVVGTGKLATELLSHLGTHHADPVTSWADAGPPQGPGIVVHAGSGKDLSAVISYCQASHSTLVELATGSAIENIQAPFPVVLCPNTNILMLKFMAMLEQSGHLFKGDAIQLTESHQASKASTPGTALDMAQSLGLEATQVRSVRDPIEQAQRLGIPQAHLGRHAYHHIVIEDAVCSITMETRVLGSTPYAHGVAQIVAAIQAHALDNRRYNITEFIHNGWL